MESSYASEIINEIIAKCFGEEKVTITATDTLFVKSIERHFEIGQSNDDETFVDLKSEDEIKLIDHSQSVEKTESKENSQVDSTDHSDIGESDTKETKNGRCESPRSTEEKIHEKNTSDQPRNKLAIKVELPSNGNFYSNKYLRSLGFAIRVREKTRQLVNLPLFASYVSTASKFDIRCHGFPFKMIENELIPIFETFGEIYDLTVVTNSGVVCVTYTNQDDAAKAVNSLHHQMVQGRLIEVENFLHPGQLFVKPIPLSATKGEIFETFKAITTELVDVMMFNDPSDDRKNRGFCYLDYGDQEKASDARRDLLNQKVFGRLVSIDWPDKRCIRSIKADTLYISNLRSGLHCSDLQNMFGIYGEVTEVIKHENFASVQFRSSEYARAAGQIDKNRLGNENVEISLTKQTSKKVTQVVRKKDEFGSVKFQNAEGSNRPPCKVGKVGTSLTKPPEKKFSKVIDESLALYITNLRSGIHSSDLRTMFSVYGEVTEIDINDNFAIVRFRNAEGLICAARKIDKKQLGNENVEISFKQPSGQKFQKVPDSSPTLYISNLRSGLQSSDLRKMFSVYGEVTAIDKDDNFASIQFRNAEGQICAARKIDKKQLGNKNVEISFKQPSGEKFQKVPDESLTLYMTNLRAGIHPSDLRNIFSVYGEIVEIDKNDNVASVRFSNIIDSKRAARDIDKKTLGNNVEISFSKQ